MLSGFGSATTEIRGDGVEIRGEGLAACACASLLARRGIARSVKREQRAKLPAILANRATQSLLGDIFSDRTLFNGLRQINQRIVAWGSQDAISVPHSAVVVSEQSLLDSLWQQVPPLAEASEEQAPRWIVAGSRACRLSTDEKVFGSREASALPVHLKPGTARDAFWIESVEGGWLYVLPIGQEPAEEDRALLIAVSQETGLLIDQSRLVKNVIEIPASQMSDRRVFCSPRIGTHLAAPGWLACGTAAMSFDPLSGEGAGHAAREAILAAAVIEGIHRGLPPDRLLAHYQARLTAGFERHLRICLGFYTQARAGAWWDGEIELLSEGIAWCRENIDVEALKEFQLVDFDLQPRS